jgi:hypothetical protein
MVGAEANSLMNLGNNKNKNTKNNIVDKNFNCIIPCYSNNTTSLQPDSRATQHVMPDLKLIN